MQRTDLVVLAVDDDIINLKLLKSMLMKNSHVKEVVEAKNGSDAIGVLKARDDIDLILLDIIMPLMNGIEMLEIIKTDNNLRQLPIIILTTDETKKSEVLKAGANGFLIKPIRNDDLLKKMAMVIL